MNNEKLFEKLIGEARTPDKLSVLYQFRNDLEKREFSVLLRYWWITTEFPNQYPKYIILEMFKLADKKFLNDKSSFDYLHNTVKVYRGVQDCSKIGKMKVKAFSWTTDLKKALWFSKRWRKDGSGKVYTAYIAKKDIFMFNNGREENEIVLNPNKLIYLKEDRA